MVPYDPKILYANLKELDIIPLNKLDAALQQSSTSQKPFHQVLLDQDLIADENLGQLIASTFQVPFIQLTKEHIRSDVLNVLPPLVAKNQRAIVFSRDENGVKLALNDPTNEDMKMLIEKKTGEPVSVYFATERDIDEVLNLYKKDLQETFDEIIKANVDEKGRPKEADVSISKIVDTLIQYAYQNKASDIHIEPEDDISVVRFRIDGVLHDVLDLNIEMHDHIVTRIKVLSKLRTDEHMSAQDGKMQMEMEKEELDIRVSIVPIVDGEKCVMRLLSSRSRQFSLHDLGMSDADLKKVDAAYNKPHGMVLSTGPTGCGKTTTIYAILKIVNSRDINIATIEDPVEYDMEGVNQIQVNPKTNLTFADGLRAILRQDPVVIFVGEIRDKETAGIATNSAMTGHLVLSTLHTNDAATSLPRLVDMNVEPFLVASTVNVIIAQRLVRKICDKCRVSYSEDVKNLKGKMPDNIVKKLFGKNKTSTLFKGKGCDVCHNTGYTGRVGIFEVLEITPEIRDLIVSKVSSDDIQELAIKQGMTSMFDDGIEKVKQGVTTIEEVMRVTKD